MAVRENEIMNEATDLQAAFIRWLRKSADVVTAAVFLSGITLFGLLAVAIQITGGKQLTAILWALAYLGVGGLVGFLFGIPRVLQGDNPAPSSSSPTSDASTIGSPPSSLPGSSAQQANRNAQYEQRVNTNLEQISDWLTKILVGVGLIQLSEIENAVRGAASYIAMGIGAEHKIFAAALVVYFSVIGFLNGYLLTRLWLAGAFSRADRGSMVGALDAMLHEADKNIQPPSLTSGLDSDGPSPSPPTTSPEASNAARDVVKLRLSQLTSPRDIAVWAKTQLSERNYEEAVNGYSKAISLAPDDIKLRLEYAASLYYAGRPPKKVSEQLLEAYALMLRQPGADESLRMKVYRALTFQSLYVSPPEGFNDTIKYGEEYIRELRGGVIEGAIAVNLAAAYGQQYAWLKEHSGSEEEMNQAREAALKYARAAIAADEKWRDRLRQLLQKDYPGKAPEDNDLEVFEGDTEFRALLGLT